MRSFADLARLFASSSSSDGNIGFLVTSFIDGVSSFGITGNPGGRSGKEDASLKIDLHKRSSREWKVITLTLPPTPMTSSACCKDSSAAPNSSLTAIRIAWNTLFAGCPPLRLAAAGIPSLISSTSSPVVRIGSLFLVLLFFEQSV